MAVKVAGGAGRTGVLIAMISGFQAVLPLAVAVYLLLAAPLVLRERRQPTPEPVPVLEAAPAAEPRSLKGRRRK